MTVGGRPFFGIFLAVFESDTAIPGFDASVSMNPAVIAGYLGTADEAEAPRQRQPSMPELLQVQDLRA